MWGTSLTASSRCANLRGARRRIAPEGASENSASYEAVWIDLIARPDEATLFSAREGNHRFDKVVLQ